MMSQGLGWSFLMVSWHRPDPGFSPSTKHDTNISQSYRTQNREYQHKKQTCKYKDPNRKLRLTNFDKSPRRQMEKGKKTWVNGIGKIGFPCRKQTNKKAIKLNSWSCVTHKNQLKMVRWTDRWTDGWVDDGLQPWKSRKIRLRKDSLVLTSAEFFEISCWNLRYKGRRRRVNGRCQTESSCMAEGSFEQTERGTCRWENLPTVYLIIR